jgi:ferrochelatase
MPFLRNVTRGRSIPEQRLALVAEQYEFFGGSSEINSQNRDLIFKVEGSLRELGVELPIYFGNRNWEPYVKDALHQIVADGHHRVLVFTTSAYGSYSACRQYREDLTEAQGLLEHPETVQITKIRHYYDHPLFTAALIDGVNKEVEAGFAITAEDAAVIATAHSIPTEMANCTLYVQQLAALRKALSTRLTTLYGSEISVLEAYQSRSGAPSQPWLEPDVSDLLRELSHGGVRQVLIVPIGFISDHQEVRYDLDTLARTTATALDLSFFRSKTVSNSPHFTAMVVDLVDEYLSGRDAQRIDNLEPQGWVCSAQCCRQ